MSADRDWETCRAQGQLEYAWLRCTRRFGHFGEHENDESGLTWPGVRPASPANVGSVAVDPDLARRLATAGRKSEEWRERRDDLIREAAKRGGTLREIAAAVGLSNPGVLRVIRRGELEAQHITPLRDGGDKDDPDNLRFVTPEENQRLRREDT